jgi:hypothetical protein
MHTASVHLSGWALLLAIAAPAPAQLPSVADGRLGVDRVDLSTGQKLYGFILKSSADELTLAVERDWLHRTHPALAEQYTAREQDEATLARSELLERIEKWMEQRQADAGFHRYLAAERERIELSPTTAPTSFFMQLQLPSDQVRRSQVAAADRRHIAGIAYQHALENVVTTPVATLARRLEAAGVDAAAETVALTDKLPNLQPQSSLAWAARQALVEHERLQPWVYQGTGASFFKAGEAIDMAELVPQFLQNNSLDAITQLGVELGLPEFKQLANSKSAASKSGAQEWWRPVVRKAAAEGARGVLITRLEQGMLSERVRVESYFFARDDDDQWFEVVRFESQVTIQQAPADQQQQLEQDPQIAQVLSLLKGLGLADDGRVQLAINHGAATQTALRDVAAQFLQFTERHARELDGPPIPVAPTR